MKQLILFFALSLVFISSAKCQHIAIDFMPGLINYAGDLQPRGFTFVEARPALQVGVNFNLNDHFYIRAGYLAGTVHADDKMNATFYALLRNLNFTSIIKEGSLSIEYDIFKLNITKKWTPYIFGGVGYFHFDPYTYDTLGRKVYLPPLSTEGEGLPEYPNRKPYALYQFNLLGGIGARYAVSGHISIGFEVCERHLFTDYLDDVSTTYVDKNILLAERGPEAVELAFRGNEVNPSAAYPAAGAPRGNPSKNDAYYTMLLRVTYSFESGGGAFSTGNRRSVRCPRNVL